MACKRRIEKDRKVTVVTGGTGYLGNAVVDVLIKKGFHVIASGRKERVSLDSTASYFKADIRNKDEVNRLLQYTIDQFNSVDMLIHSAGIARDNLLLSMKEKEWDEVWDVNFTGAVNVIEVFAEEMAARKEGSIVAVSSISGLKGQVGQANYSASKGALCGFIEYMSRIYGSYNIRINCVIPGYIEGGMGKVQKKAMETAIKRSNLGMLTDVNDVAELICAIAMNRSISGQIVRVDSRIEN